MWEIFGSKNGRLTMVTWGIFWPVFGGNPGDWRMWIHSDNDSTKQFGCFCAEFALKTEVCDRINRVFFGLSPLLWRPVLIRLEHQVILLAPRSSSVPSLGFRWNEEQYRARILWILLAIFFLGLPLARNSGFWGGIPFAKPWNRSSWNSENVRTIHIE